MVIAPSHGELLLEMVAATFPEKGGCASTVCSGASFAWWVLVSTF
jgi:hypothetical protein